MWNGCGSGGGGVFFGGVQKHPSPLGMGIAMGGLAWFMNFIYRAFEIAR